MVITAFSLAKNLQLTLEISAPYRLLLNLEETVKRYKSYERKRFVKICTEKVRLKADVSRVLPLLQWFESCVQTTEEEGAPSKRLVKLLRSTDHSQIREQIRE